MKRITMKLRTDLQNAEVAILALQQADRQVELDIDREEWAVACRQHRDKTKALNEIITELAQKVHGKGYESDVECEIRPLEKSQRVQIIRLDTGEIVETRAMTAEEKQAEFNFEGINDPEDSAKNAKAFLKKKGKDTTEDETEEDHTAGVGGPDDDTVEDMMPESVGDIESGESFPKNKVKEVKIKFDKDLDFGAVIKVAQDGGFHYGYRIASTRSPKASHAVPVLVDSVTYTDYQVMLRQAALAMTGRLTSDPKFRTMGVDRVNRITAVIDDFCSEELTQAVAAD